MSLFWTEQTTVLLFRGAFISFLTQKPNSCGSFTLRARSCRGLHSSFNTHWKCLEGLLTTRVSLSSWHCSGKWAGCTQCAKWTSQSPGFFQVRMWELKLYETGNTGIVSPLSWVSHLDIYLLPQVWLVFLCQDSTLQFLTHTLLVLSELCLW